MSDNPWNEPEHGSSETAAPRKAASKAEQAVENAREDKASSKEWKLIEKTLNGLFVEQRRARRWGFSLNC